jgi:hypothetical protein
VPNGTVTLSVTLTSRVYLTGNVVQSCPLCAPGPSGNTCTRGPQAGQPCVPNNGPNTTSVDCPPDGLYQAPLTIALAPLTTGPTSRTSSNGVFCTGQVAGSTGGAFGKRTVRTIEEAGAATPSGLSATPTSVSVGSVFCIGSVSPTIDPVASLPGPGALSLVTDMQLVP